MCNKSDGLKRVLIITYHWPPSGGITVLRCLKIAKYLREFGWEPVIFTAKNASYQYLDYSNEQDIPEGIEIHRVPIFEPINLFKSLTGRKRSAPLQNITSNSEKAHSLLDKLGMWIRGNYFIPDARYRWIKPSVKYLNRYLESHPVDAIFTDGPPHTNTVIGMRLAQRFSIPWLADFQDPWTQVDYYKDLYIGNRADKKHKALEQEVFRTAKKITIASPTWKKDLENIGAKHVDVLFYGFDEADFTGYTPQETDKIVIFHGGLMGKDRLPSGFFKALKQLIQQDESVRNRFELRLAGEVDHSVKTAIEANGLESITTYLGMIKRQAVFQELSTASLLLLPVNKAKNADGRIPGKLFELMRSNKPILAYGSLHCDVEQVLFDSKRGKLLAYEDIENTKLILQDLLDGYTMSWFDTRQDISNYSNYQLTKHVANLLHDITN